MALEPVGGDALQFDRLVSNAPSTVTASSPMVPCRTCQSPIHSEYYEVDGQPVCDSCRTIVEAHAAAPQRVSHVIKAAVFGIGAAIAGAAIYYAVIAFANLEIGFVAILIGYMVGHSVRKGAKRGSRGLQVLAVVLTYWSVGLAYTPLIFSGAATENEKKAATAGATPGDDSAAGATRSSEPPATENRQSISATRALLVLGGLTFALPVLIVFGSLPSGLISAFIILIGMRQAWQLTAAAPLAVSGPYKVGGGAPPAIAAP